MANKTQVPRVTVSGLVLGLGLGLGLALAPIRAHAAPPQPEPSAPDPLDDSEPEDSEPLDEAQERARAAYVRGTQLYNDAQFSEALAAFQEAATLYASPDFQFNIAKCYERLGDYEEAVRHFEIYLRTADDPPDRAVIETSIADLERRIAEGADAGEVEPAAPLEPETKPGRALIITGGALLGVGVGVGLGGGLGFGLMVSRDNASLGQVETGNPDGLTFAEAEAVADRARGNQTLERVMVSVGSAVAVTGVALLAVGLDKKNKGGEPSALKAAAASLRVAPTWSSTGAGLVLGGSF